MRLREKLAAHLTEADLLSLIEDRESEGKTLEYKLELPGGNDNGKKEFLYDTTSLANTRGGYLIFGMAEAAGVATDLVGIDGINPDQEILRLEQILRTGVRPAINGVETVKIDLANGKVAIVMRIPRSWNPPHQVTFQNAFRFYGRDTNGKYQLDVDELRSVFAISASIADRMREFRADRASKIASGDTPVAPLAGGSLVLHVVPFSAFGTAPAFPLDRAEPSEFPPIGNRQSRRAQITFDGLLMTSNDAGPPEDQRAYVQVLRTGAVEAVAPSLASGPKRDSLQLPKLEAHLVTSAARYISSLSRLGVEPPIAVFASLVGVAGMKLLQDNFGSFPSDIPHVVLERDQLHFLETVLTTAPNNPREVGKLLQATLNHLANAAGLRTSRSFDSFGEFVGGLD